MVGGPENSKLSSHGGFDMVVAVTQAAVNSTMKNYLDTIEREPFRRVYVFDSDTQGPVEKDYNELLNEAGGVDPFLIPTGADADSSDAVKAMRNAKFLYGFEIDLGLPLVDLDRIPSIISFKSDGTVVDYNMVFRSFKIVELFKTGGGFETPKFVWKSYEQGSVDPWVFRFNVNLDLQEENINNGFHKLPKEAQDRIKEIGQDTFSIQNLYMLLNTASLSSGVQIENMNTTSDAYGAALDLIDTVFKRAYFDPLVAEGSTSDEVLLGYTVVQRPQSTEDWSIVPTNFTIYTSAYIDSVGNPTEDYDAYTLCYELITQNKTLPKPVGFPWNWVPVSRLDRHHGVISISKQAFTAFCKERFDDELRIITLKPKAIHDSSFTSVTIDFNASPYDEEKSKEFQYTIADDPDDSSKVLTYSHFNSHRDSSSGVNGGESTMEVFTYSTVYFRNNKVQIENEVRCRFRFTRGVFTDVKGNWVHRKTSITYTLGVTDDGKSAIEFDHNEVNEDEEVGTSGWDDFISLGDMKRGLNMIKGKVIQRVEKYNGAYLDSMKKELNGAQAFVFPGGRTFSFKDMEFSDHGDLISRITYVDPSD